MQPIDSIERYAYGMSKYLVMKRHKLNVIIKRNNTKMIKLDHITEKDIKEYNPSWP